MIPYYNADPLIHWGWFRIHTFGVLVAIGILVGSWVTLRRAKERGIDLNQLRSAITWLLVGGFVVAHLLAVVAYEPHTIARDPWRLLKIWDGLASTGGFLGAFIGLYLFTRKHKLPFGEIADVVALGLLPGWIFGRLGCYTAHDHPGLPTDFPLAVAYPSKPPAEDASWLLWGDAPRHDLGFYEMLFTILLFLVFEWVRRRPLAPGRLATWLGLIYSPVRFALDFLRIRPDETPNLHGDVRYFGLTPAQYAFILLFALCVYLLARKPVPTPAQAKMPGRRSGARA